MWCKDCNSGKFKTGTSTATSCTSKRTTCGAGQKFTAGNDSEKAKDDSTCTACPDGTYKNSGTTCASKRTTCGVGKKFTAGSNSEKTKDDTTCTACPDGTYKNSGTTCASKRTTCGAGQKFTAGSNSEKTKDDATCTTCSDGTYKNSGTTCKDHSVCSAGTYLKDATAAKDGTCTACPTNTFQPKDSVRDTCSSHSTCAVGKYLKDATAAKDGTCTACPTNTFQPKDSVRDKCSSHSTCAAGRYLKDATAAKDGTCIACPTNMFQPKDSVRDRCRSHSTCAAGKYLKDATAAKDGTCTSKRTSCGAGQRFIAGSSSEQTKDDTTCRTCSDGTYKNSPTTCSSKRNSCGAADTFTAGRNSEKTKDDTICTACSGGTYKNSPTTCAACATGKYRTGTSTAAECVPHMACSAGKYLAGADKAKDGVCTDHGTCSAGFFLKGAGANLAGSCETCPAFTYQDKLSHRLARCNDQPACGRGKTLSSESTAKLASCTACGPNTFQPKDSVRNKCGAHSTCNAGEYLKDATAVKDGTCRACLPNTYQNQDEVFSGCKDHSVCPAGKYLKDATTSKDGMCTTCGPGTFQPSSGVRDACSGHSTCSAGNHLNGATASRNGICITCTNGKYKSGKSTASECVAHVACAVGKYLAGADNTKGGACTDVGSCGAGHFLRGAGANTAGSCETCPWLQYQPQPSHQISSCSKIPTCSTGERLSSTTPDKVPNCLPCGPGNYQDARNHHLTACAVQPYCGVDQALSGLSQTNLETCQPCVPGTHRNMSRHRETRCIDTTTTTTETTTTDSLIQQAYTRFLKVSADLAAMNTTTSQTKAPGAVTSAEQGQTDARWQPEPTFVYMGGTVDVCGPGEYYHTGKQRCWDCPGGSYAPLEGVRTGGDGYMCPGRCAEGFVSSSKSTSADDCELGVKVMWHSSTHKWCTGTTDTTGEGKLWDNQGYEYIKTRDECAKAVTMLTAMPRDQRQGVTAQTLSNSCPDRFDDPGNTRPAFAECQAVASREACEHTNGTFNFPSTTLICRRSCDDFISLCKRSANANANAAPFGYCVLEHDQADLSTQKGAFYTGADGSHPGRYYLGNNFTAVCKVKECNTYEEVRGSGAKVLVNALASEEDDAQCIPNPEQFDTWERGEGHLYRDFYIVLSAFTAVYWTVAVYWLWHKHAFDCTADKNWTVNQPTPGKLLWQLSAVRLFMLLREWMRLVGMASSWGFYSISITALRFEYLAHDQGYDPDLIGLGALVASIVATVLLLPDIRLVRWQWNVCKVNMVTSTSHALQAPAYDAPQPVRQASQESMYARIDPKTLPRPTAKESAVSTVKKTVSSSTPKKIVKMYSQSLPKNWGGTEIGNMSWWHTVAIVTFEDIPQLTLTVLYYSIVGFDTRDEIAMGSLVLSVLGTFINLLVVLPLYKNRRKIFECCGNLVAKSSAPDRIHSGHVSLYDGVKPQSEYDATWDTIDPVYNAQMGAYISCGIVAAQDLDPDNYMGIYAQEMNGYLSIAETTFGRQDVSGDQIQFDSNGRRLSQILQVPIPRMDSEARGRFEDQLIDERMPSTMSKYAYIYIYIYIYLFIYI